jgi:hypothetical protein
MGQASDYFSPVHECTIYVIEVARTGDSEGSLRNRYVKKTLKYSPIAEALRQAFNPCKVEQITLVIGLLGTIEESRWRQSLTLGICNDEVSAR